MAQQFLRNNLPGGLGGLLSGGGAFIGLGTLMYAVNHSLYNGWCVLLIFADVESGRWSSCSEIFSSVWRD